MAEMCSVWYNVSARMKRMIVADFKNTQFYIVIENAQSGKQTVCLCN